MPEVQQKDPAKTQPATGTTTSSRNVKKAAGLTFRRFFAKAGVSPYDEVDGNCAPPPSVTPRVTLSWRKKHRSPQGLVHDRHQYCGPEILHGRMDNGERETGVRQLVARVAETIRDWGMKDGYFRTSEDAATFHDELVHLLIRQYAAFNSPVWFNVGCDRIEPNSDATNWHWNAATQQVEFGVTGYTRPQCSACSSTP